MKALGLSAMVWAALAASAAAQPTPPRAAALDQLAACRAIADGAQRLACYDTAATALDEAERTGQVVVLDREQVQETRRGLFGFELPTMAMFNRGGQPSPEDEIDNVSFVVRAAREIRDDEWAFTMEDGSVWRQIEGRMWGRPRPGQTAVVRRAALGSYLMNVGDAPAIRVRREQ